LDRKTKLILILLQKKWR